MVVDGWGESRAFVARLALPLGPPAGSPAWCLLPDDDPAKLGSLLRAGCERVLEVELAHLARQRALKEAAEDVSAARDWGAEARDLRRHHDAIRSGAYIPRRQEPAS